MNVTKKGGVWTEDGWVPHVDVPTPCGVISAPVRIVAGLVGRNGLPVCEVDSTGRPVHVLPGNISFVLHGGDCIRCA